MRCPSCHHDEVFIGEDDGLCFATVDVPEPADLVARRRGRLCGHRCPPPRLRAEIEYALREIAGREPG